METLKAIKWRELFARLPLPMLALAASYGVYDYSRLFVPEIVAIIQAAAFELTYVGLAVSRSLTESQGKRARSISIGAVVVSVLYNSLAGLFHRNPTMLTGLWTPAELGLAVLHGAPLAIVAYFVADLLLHTSHQPAQVITQPTGSAVTISEVKPSELPTPAPAATVEAQTEPASFLSNPLSNFSLINSAQVFTDPEIAPVTTPNTLPAQVNEPPRDWSQIIGDVFFSGDREAGQRQVNAVKRVWNEPVKASKVVKFNNQTSKPKARGKAKPVTTEQRREAIRLMIQEGQSLPTKAELARTYNVSAVMIGKDIKLIEDELQQQAAV